jgi:hypothetical protein
MKLDINVPLVVTSVFYFILSAVLARIFKGANFFFKIVLFFLIAGVLKEISSVYRTEALISILSGIVFIYIDLIVDFFSAVKRWTENVFYGISYRVRIITGIIGKILFAIRWVLRLVLIPIANLFTWFYNFLSRTFHWNRVFIPLTEQFKRKYREAESRRPKHESRQSGAGNTHKAGSTNSEQEEYIRRAKEKVRQAREEAERAKREEEQPRGNAGGDQRTPRQILGLGETFTLEELKRAYRLAASRYHPDKHLGMSERFKKEAEAEFIKVQNAYEVLMKGFL